MRRLGFSRFKTSNSFYLCHVGLPKAFYPVGDRVGQRAVRAATHSQQANLSLIFAALVFNVDMTV